jgi:DNA-binding NarL/FixJ family response regulator
MSSSFENNGASIRVLIADSNLIQSQLLANVLQRDSQLTTSVCRQDEASWMQTLQSCPIDVILVSADWVQNWQNLFGLVRTIQISFPTVGFVFLSNSYSRDLVVNLLRTGVRGLFSPSSQPIKALCKCIRAVHEGQFWLNTEQFRYAVEALEDAPVVTSFPLKNEVCLTARELQTVQLVAEGLSNRTAANQLRVTENTIKKTLVRVYEKLGVSNRVQLVLYMAKARSDAAYGVGEQAVAIRQQA